MAVVPLPWWYHRHGGRRWYCHGGKFHLFRAKTAATAVVPPPWRWYHHGGGTAAVGDGGGTAMAANSSSNGGGTTAVVVPPPWGTAALLPRRAFVRVFAHVVVCVCYTTFS
jgi:hypothetical protein